MQHQLSLTLTACGLGGGGLENFFLNSKSFCCNQLQLCQQCIKSEESGVQRVGQIFLAVCQKEMNNLAGLIFYRFRKTNLGAIFGLQFLIAASVLI